MRGGGLLDVLRWKVRVLNLESFEKKALLG